MNQLRTNGTYSIGMAICAVLQDECGDGLLSRKRGEGPRKDADEVVMD